MPDSRRQERVFSCVFGLTRSKDLLICVFRSIFKFSVPSVRLRNLSGLVKASSSSSGAMFCHL